jgi:membrane protein insertase Oxa1/YidC/SpoIIIJ
VSGVLYFIFIYPVETVIELSYLLAWRVFRDATLSIAGVSLLVSVLTLPLTGMAERQQRGEREIQNRMKRTLDKIRAVFRGDERYMLVSTYYRQCGYHPVYALRSSLGLLIQVPLFIAAYHFLSRLEDLNDPSFLFGRHLAAPDGALTLGGVTVNALPLLMTALNCASTALYARGFSLGEKARLYGTAAVFLALLYNSPAGLVLYWTCNNLFSVLKNALRGRRIARKILFAALEAGLCALAFYALFFHPGVLKKRIVFAAAVCALALFPVVRRRLAGLLDSLLGRISDDRASRSFALSALQLALLAGVVIPGALIASSVAEFSFIGPLSSPLPFVGITAAQAAGAALYLSLLFALSPAKTRKLLCVGAGFFSCAALLNTFAFCPDYGFMLPSLNFAVTPPPPKLTLNAVSLFALAAVLFLVYYGYAQKRRGLLISAQTVVLLALGVMGALSAARIAADFGKEGARKETAAGHIQPEYTFSRTGRNLLVLMLDRGISGFVPEIFAEKPELLSEWSGFTYYPNCVSFSAFTFQGAPPIFGGYEYTPAEIHKRDKETLRKKYHDGMFMLPRLLADSGFSVTVSDLPYIDRDYNPGGGIRQIMPQEKDFASFLAKERDVRLIDYYPKITGSLLRFSLFKMSPPLLRLYVYDRGDYLSYTESAFAYPEKTLNNYALLHYLPRLTGVTEEREEFASIIVNNLTHEPAFMEAPDYVPATPVENKGAGKWAGDEHYHVNMAAFLLLGHYFDFLKENGVYDNTRIIVVADHGRYFKSTIFPDSALPNGEGVDGYNPLLLVKDFNASGALQTDFRFMTNADTPLLAARGIIENPRNPWTGTPLQADKDGGAIVNTSKFWRADFKDASRYAIKRGEWFRVKENIFKPENWSPAP